MAPFAIFLASLGLLQGIDAHSVPTRTWHRKERAAGAPALPTSTLVSDFKKDNVSAQWAEGHPKQWGTEDAKYEFPVQPDYSWFDGAVSADENFLVMVNATDAKVVRIGTGATASMIKVQSNKDMRAERVRLVSAPGGQYDLLVSASDYYGNDTTFQIRLSADGVATSASVAYRGKLSSFDAWPFSKDGRRMLTITHGSGRAGVAYAYDLDNPTSNITLSGHSDSIMSGAFSPDGKYISTAAWDGSGKLWNATSGELIYTFGPTGGQNWLTNFSPDGQQVILSIGPSAPSAIKTWSLSNLTAEPAILGPYKNWVRAAVWSSDGEYLATGSYGLVLIYKMPEGKVVQTWESEDRSNWEVRDFVWLKGNKKLVYRNLGGLEMYDFEKNLKYRWGPGDFDHYGGSAVGATFVLKSKGWIGGIESDQKVRFWKYPA